MLLENTHPDIALKTTGKLLLVLLVLLVTSQFLPAGFDLDDGFYMPWTPYLLSYPSGTTLALWQDQVAGVVLYLISWLPKIIVIACICLAIKVIVNQNKAKVPATTIILSKQVIVTPIFCLALCLYLLIPYIPEVVGRLVSQYLVSGTIPDALFITEAMIFITKLDVMVIFVISVYLLLLIHKIHESENKANG
jgi:hypothetical protein